MSVCHDRVVVDDVLSEAVVTYVWGTQCRPWPSRDAEAVREKYGDLALDLVPRIQAIFALVDAMEVDWSSEDLNGAAHRIESLVRSMHPELGDDAIRAVGNQFAYCWK